MAKRSWCRSPATRRPSWRSRRATSCGSGRIASAWSRHDLTCARLSEGRLRGQSSGRAGRGAGRRAGQSPGDRRDAGHPAEVPGEHPPAAAPGRPGREHARAAWRAPPCPPGFGDRSRRRRPGGRLPARGGRRAPAGGRRVRGQRQAVARRLDRGARQPPRRPRARHARPGRGRQAAPSGLLAHRPAGRLDAALVGALVMTEALAIAASVCFTGALVVLVRLHFVRTRLDPVRDAVSDYGVGEYHRHYQALVVLLGVGGALLTAGLARAGEAGNVGLAWLATYSASRIAIAGFMTDLPGRRVTGEGRIHAFLAAVAFTSIAFASSNITAALSDETGWEGHIHGVLHLFARLVAVTAIATLVAYLVPALRARVFGVVERCLYAASFAWLLTMSIHLAVLTG